MPRPGKPEEVCGLVRGRHGAAVGIHRARNVAPDPISDYEVDPQALLVQFAWEEQGDALVAIYHSHPVSPAYPSASDAFNAHYPDAVYLICSLQVDEHPVLNGFWLRELPIPFNLDAIRSDIQFSEVRPGRWGAYLPPEASTPAALAHLERPLGQALYVVYETADEDAFRVVAVEPVMVEIGEAVEINGNV